MWWPASRSTHRNANSRPVGRHLGNRPVLAPVAPFATPCWRRRLLVPEVDHLSNGEVTRGVFYIGWDPESQTLRSHFFASSGEILEYTHQLAGDTLTIWFGDTEPPAKFVGTFDAEATA